VEQLRRGELIPGDARSGGHEGSAEPNGTIERWLEELDRWIRRKDSEMGGPAPAAEPAPGEVAAEGE
jgi:hypothetical protein